MHVSFRALAVKFMEVLILAQTKKEPVSPVHVHVPECVSCTCTPCCMLHSTGVFIASHPQDSEPPKNVDTDVSLDIVSPPLSMSTYV